MPPSTWKTATIKINNPPCTNPLNTVKEWNRSSHNESIHHYIRWWPNYQLMGLNYSPVISIYCHKTKLQLWMQFPEFWNPWNSWIHLWCQIWWLNDSMTNPFLCTNWHIFDQWRLSCVHFVILVLIFWNIQKIGLLLLTALLYGPLRQSQK